MKPPPNEEAQRWLAQARHVLEVAQTLLDQACYAESCFHAEQAAQLALKAFLYGHGERVVPIHSVKALVERCATDDATFHDLVDAGKVLDHYYIPTRYPDALPFPDVPYESYTEPEAREAVTLTTRIYEMVKQKLSR